MSEWTETKAVLSEVEQLFNRDDDIRYIFDVKKMAKEIDSHCSSYLLETKEIIKSEFQLLFLLSAVDSPISVFHCLVPVEFSYTLREDGCVLFCVCANVSLAFLRPFFSPLFLLLTVVELTNRIVAKETEIIAPSEVSYIELIQILPILYQFFMRSFSFCIRTIIRAD